jgi:hypothetical protein
MTKLLPPEIWIIILRHATYAPDYLDTSALEPLIDDHRSWTSPISSPVLRDSFRVKRNLVLVSKYWRIMAIGYLLEHIIIRSIERVYSIANTLKRTYTAEREGEDGERRSERDGRSDTLQLGRLVRRLDFHPDVQWNRIYSKEFKTFASIVLDCDNLRVLTIGFNSMVTRGWEMLRPAIKNSNSSLRHLSCYDFGVDSEVLELLPQFQLVEVLFLHVAPGRVPTHLDHCSFPRLHTLEIGGGGALQFLSLLLRWFTFPAVVRFISRGSAAELTVPGGFLETYGKQILHLDFSPEASQVYGLLPRSIFRICPSIQHCVVPASPCPSSFDTPPSALIRVSLRVFTVYSPQVAGIEEWTRLLSATSCPTLRCVRLMDFANRSFRESSHIRAEAERFRRWIEIWEARGVRFEDRHGALVEIPDDLDFPPTRSQIRAAEGT